MLHPQERNHYAQDEAVCHNPSQLANQGSSQTGGTQFVVDYDAGKKQYYLKLLSRLKDVRSVNVEQDFVNFFVANLGKKIERFVSPVVVYSTHTRQKQIF